MAGIEIDNYSASANLRFSGQAGFIGDPYDFSGVGRSTDSVVGSANRVWATLIGANTFVSAAHYSPRVGETIRFTDGNSTSSLNYDYLVKGAFVVPGTDIWIGYTDGPIESSLKRYAFDNTPANSLADTGLAGQSLFMNGDRALGGPGLITDHAVGINEAESWWEAGDSSHATPEWTALYAAPAAFDILVTFQNESGDNANNYAFHEGQVQRGDSGSPLFQVASGELEIVGLGWAVADSLDGNFIDTFGPRNTFTDPLEMRDASYFSYVGSYEDQISATLSRVPPPIPEPGSAGMFLLAIASACRRKR